MDEAQRLGVERLAWALLEAVVDELGIARRGVAAQYLVAAVALVVEQRMPYVTHVNANLVGAASLELALYHRHMIQVLDGVIVGHGMLALVALGEYRHLQAVAQAAPYVALDGAVHLFHGSPHHRYVLPLRGLVEELQSQRCLGVRSLGNDEETAGVFVDAVHQSHAWVGNVIVWVVLEMPGEGIDQCAVVVAMARMHAHSCGLVHHQQVVVLIDDVQRDVLGDNLILVARTVHHHRDLIARMHAVVALDGAAVHADALCLGGVLDSVARRSLDALHQVLVYAQQHMSWLHHIVVVLPVVAPVLGEVGVAEVALYLESLVVEYVLVKCCHQECQF